jgi:predicted ABC-type ATPase
MKIYTDNVDLCLLRAKTRYQNGGHLVDPAIITEMYSNTLEFLKKHYRVFSTIQFYNVTNFNIELVFKDEQPNWLVNSNLY